jgi:cytochrome b561
MKFVKKRLNVPTHYNRFHILIHWLVVVTILLQMITGDKIALEFFELRNDAIKNDGNKSNSQIHILGGVFIVLLMATRVFLRIKFGVPAPTKKTNDPLKFLSTFVHLGIYLVLFAIPITGLLAFSTINVDLGIAHKILVNILYLFVIFHLIGVAYHQIFLGDNIMERITSWK